MEKIQERLLYDADTGVFYHRTTKGEKGRIAGTPRHAGYIKIVVDGKEYQAHRLAFLLMTGAFPKGDVDHINGVRADNRWRNLRDVSRSVNGHNRTRRNSNAPNLPAGVRKHGNKWVAQISFKKGTKTYLGLYETPEAASAAYTRAKQEYILGNS